MKRLVRRYIVECRSRDHGMLRSMWLCIVQLLPDYITASHALHVNMCLHNNRDFQCCHWLRFWYFFLQRIWRHRWTANFFDSVWNTSWPGQLGIWRPWPRSWHLKRLTTSSQSWRPWRRPQLAKVKCAIFSTSTPTSLTMKTPGSSSNSPSTSSRPFMSGQSPSHTLSTNADKSIFLRLSERLVMSSECTKLPWRVIIAQWVTCKRAQVPWTCCR